MTLTKNQNQKSHLRKKEKEKTSKFASNFNNLNLSLHGVRLPKFEIEKKYIKRFDLKDDINTYDFLREICLKRFSELGLDKVKNKKTYIPFDDNVLSVDLEKKIILVDPIKGIIDND